MIPDILNTELLQSMSLVKPHSHLLCSRQQEAGRGESRHAKKGACVSDIPTETGVMIMDNCEKDKEGGSLEEVAFGHILYHGL